MGIPLVSIIVPIFNVEEYISECIESIQRQSYQNIQIILIDDGSTDQSGAICDQYAADDHRIEVIHQQNKGPVRARKSGLMRAEGKYIGFVDGDDYIDPDMYEMLVKEMENSEADFVHAGYWESNAKKVMPPKKMTVLPPDKTSFLQGAILGQDGYITPSLWSKLYKADLIRKSFSLLPDDCALGEDVLALCICVLESEKIVLMDEAYYHYRVRNDSLSHKNHINDLKNIIKLYGGLCDLLCLYGRDKDTKNMTDQFLWNHLLEYMSRIADNEFQIAKYYFSHVDKLKGKRILIYGAGAVGRDYYAQISRYSDCQIVAWVDAHPEKYHYPHIDLYGLEALRLVEFDMLIIAVWEEKLADEISVRLTQDGVEQSKIFWSRPQRFTFKKRG